MEIIKKSYVFANKLNGTDQTGIVEVYSAKIICICNEENSELILAALESQQELDAVKEELNIFIELKTQVVSCESDLEATALEQNKIMRTWFEERTGLKDSVLGDHMDRIDKMLASLSSSHNLPSKYTY